LFDPFPQDADASGNPQKLFFGGMDAGGRNIHDTAWIELVPFTTFGSSY
jgi:hypothetical protein